MTSSLLDPLRLQEDPFEIIAFSTLRLFLPLLAKTVAFPLPTGPRIPFSCTNNQDIFVLHFMVRNTGSHYDFYAVIPMRSHELMHSQRVGAGARSKTTHTRKEKTEGETLSGYRGSRKKHTPFPPPRPERKRGWDKLYKRRTMLRTRSRPQMSVF